MGIRFQCPNGHKLNVKADLAGKRASCPECGVKLVIPAASGVTAAPTSGGWHLRTAAGEQLGPATNEEFSKLIASGRVTADAHVWREGWAEWKLARDAADDLPMPLAAVPIAVAPITPSPVIKPPVPLPVVPAPEVAAPEPVESVVTSSSSDPDLAAEKPLVSDPIAADSSALAASNYVFQRRRTKRMQLTLTIIMLLTVIVLAGVLVWVLRSNASLAPEARRSDSPHSSIASAENC